MAKKLHPDKVPKEEAKSAKKNFQQVLAAYNVLKDPQRRNIYDRTGSVQNAEASNIEQFVQAYQYFRDKFPEISVKDINSFEQKYRKSMEEQDDLMEFLVENEGDVTNVLHDIILSRNGDIGRFLRFFQKIIKQKDYQYLASNFRRTKGKITKLDDEAEEAEAEMKLKFGGLKEAMMKRQKERQQNENDFLRNIMSKYGGNDAVIDFGLSDKKLNWDSNTFGNSQEDNVMTVQRNNGKRDRRSPMNRTNMKKVKQDDL